MLIGVLLYIYRRKLQNSFSKNLNRIVHVSHITHLKNPDDGVFNSLDYYTNDYEESCQTSPEPEINITNYSDIPYSSMSRENRNYFIYGKSSRIRSDINNLNRSNTNDVMNSGKRYVFSNNSQFNSIKSNNGNILNLRLLNSISRPKITANQISSPVTTPSESIYDNGKANSLASTTIRVIPPIPTFSSNNYTQPKEILRGPQMIPVTNENDLIHEFPNSVVNDTSAATITTATVTTGASEADSSNYKPILSFISKLRKNSSSSADNGLTKEGFKGDDSNRIIVNSTTEVVDLDLFPIEEFYDLSSQDDSYARLSRETNIFDKHPEQYNHN
ncbi:hypothetical protein RclHR1_03600009 [Rhizophagus clarus]|nr:hypothetical protein RclHR1_03600009 [Rhizophagus clarus]